MSLSELYSLVTMPRVSGVTQRVVTTDDFNSEELNVGISGASISSYILKPSPKLIWSHSIPPSFIITSLEIFGDEIFVGIYNKVTKEYLVQIIQKLKNDSKLVLEIKLDSRILKIKKNLNNLILITEEDIICYDLNFKVNWKLNSLYKINYSKFIENNLILVIELNLAKKILNFRLVDFNGNEISSKLIESNDDLKNLNFNYNDGNLYQYFNNKLKLYKIPNFQDLKTLDLTDLSIEAGDNVSLISPIRDRLILTVNSSLYLINSNFEIIVSDIKANSNLELITLENVISINNQYQGILLTNSEISGFTFNLDSNNLKDSLGKRFTKESKTSFKEIPSIFDINDNEIDISPLLKSKDLNIDLLKFFNSTKGYYTESDRLISSELFNELVNHLLAFEKKPETAFIYVLTHPLFPTVKDLLQNLKNQPRLLRQAIVTANISIEELLNELNVTENDEIFKDIIVRLLEFPREKIIFKDLNNFKIVERIINLNFGFELISLLIDSTGFFTWDEELINKLLTILSGKIDSINSSSKLLSVMDQIHEAPNKSEDRIPTYSIEKLSI